MYIEFHLPSGAGGQAAGHNLAHIKRELRAWSQRYQIPYTEKTVKYTHRVCFNSPDEYTFFALTWDSRYRDFVLIDIP
jgi:hypothetical protein